VWNAASGELKCTIETQLPNRSDLSRLPGVLSWRHDGRFLAFLHDDETIRIMEADTAKVLCDLVSGTREVRCLAWSPDGARIVSGGNDERLTLWNPRTGRIESSFSSESACSVCWSPDGLSIATASPDTNVYVWDAVTGKNLHTLQGHTTFVHTVSWSADGERIASADEAGSIRIWDPRTGKQTLTLTYPGGVPQIAWNPDSQRLASVGYGGDAAVRIFDANVTRPLRPFW
jgi:WD40 repeat protein